ncbi:preprotein translocase subunit YajC [Microbacterium radiodurans]|uniref:Preprotein translocase subunit YajC n=1 Tax=Microbacterium radiodurans TaxID=661398 RepID=A0A5J5IRC9_9MICO|nr:preprotein translocase subunit YajC [Microbacterium radiodurans]KAA9087015.1 preprotein translocase subunit YajC [Microbacterium radiodurans]
MHFLDTTPTNAQPVNPLLQFFAEYGLLIILALLIVFMFYSQRRRAQRMKAEQAEKAKQLLPGAKVLLQGGFYGTIVAYDGEDLSKSAIVELAPGVEVEVHSQAVLRVVDPTEGSLTEDEYIEAEEHHDEYVADVEQGLITSVSDDEARAKAAERTDKDDKHQA